MVKKSNRYAIYKDFNVGGNIVGWVELAEDVNFALGDVLSPSIRVDKGDPYLDSFGLIRGDRYSTKVPVKEMEEIINKYKYRNANRKGGKNGRQK